MREKDFQGKLRHWALHFMTETFAFECKVSHTDSLPFDALAPHQKQSLYVTKHASLFYKISDDSPGFKPYDGFMMVHEPAYVVVMFTKYSKKEFWMIDIDIWIKEEETSDRKSLTRERASVIGKRGVLA